MKTICGGHFVTLNSHKNDLEGLVAQNILWRSVTRNALVKINHDDSLS
jgi:hypothetical protein